MRDGRTVVKQMSVNIDNKKTSCIVKYMARGGVLGKEESGRPTQGITQRMVHYRAGYVYRVSLCYALRSSQTPRRVR